MKKRNYIFSNAHVIDHGENVICYFKQMNNDITNIFNFNTEKSVFEKPIFLQKTYPGSIQYSLNDFEEKTNLN